MIDSQQLATAVFILIILISIKPFRYILKTLFKSVLGASVLFAINFFGFNVGVNLFNAALIGILGIPGFASVLILAHIF